MLSGETPVAGKIILHWRPSAAAAGFGAADKSSGWVAPPGKMV
jgi:hypothetical protein